MGRDNGRLAGYKFRWEGLATGEFSSVMAMAGIVRDDARLHKYCREGNLNKIKVSKRVIHNNYNYYFACISGIY